MHHKILRKKMRVISFRKLKEFFETPGNEDSEISLRTWIDKVEHAEWSSHSDLKRDFPSADYVGNDRYVFNIKGNNYRLVVVVVFKPKWVLVRWVGRHKDYDKIDCATI